MATPTVSIQVVGASLQSIRVEVCGPAVPAMELGATAVEDEDAVLDPVAVFVRAVDLGMMDGDSAASERFRASIVSVETDPQSRVRAWLLRTENLTVGVLCILRNMLSSLSLASASITTADVTRSPDTPLLDVGEATFPPSPRRLPFQVTIEPPERLSRDRYVQIVFAAPLQTPFARLVADALTLWTSVLNLGGYPAPGHAPQSSGALPEPAFQLDSYTVEQGFPDLFLCHERCIDAVLGFAARVHEQGASIEAVVFG